MHRSRLPHRASRAAQIIVPASFVAALLFAVPVALAHAPLNEEVEELTERLEKAPNDVGLLLQRAELLALNGDTQRAEVDLRRVEKLQPGIPEPDLVRATALLKGGRTIAAERLLTSVLARTPGSSEAYRMRATARVALGRREDAAADLAAAIERSRRLLPELYLERAQILAELGQLDDAAATIEQGIARCGHAVTLEDYAVDLDVRRGMIDEALARLERLKRETPRPAAILARQGDVLRAAGREPEAWAAYTEALAAIESLPADARRRGATTELETRVRTALATGVSSEGGR